ncbi:aromatic ring-hydroxylating oxygenase subunit alpha [Dyella ginsengisoli]|uniref:aromatic ring-hydroxylating oxygenase subunit alpha n=1 Tax=Dyella ginsengisoli TaxID=363848 RepID=UPI00034DF39F|nr:SRPBCC family protein [Dyella ginsengisoli]
MSIDRRCYGDPGVFARELETIFAERLFVGTQADFARPDDYRSLRIGRKAVTIRRTRSGVRAFDNVCLHRNALIDLPGCGNRPFRCGYHGWSYADDGALAAAPLADRAGIARCRLGSYPVSESDGLHFLGLGGAAPVVDEVAQVLADTGVVPDTPFHAAVMEHACNWKLLVENVLEGYHLSFVHGNSFRPAGFTSTGRYAWHGGRHTSWSELLSADAADKTAALRRLAPQAGHFYRHAYVFPDLFLSNTNGLVGFLSHVIPEDATRTRLAWRLFELPALKALPPALRQHMQEEAIAFTQQALAEDKVLVEACQQGLEAEGFEVQLQPQEARIAHFHALYLARTNDV